MVKRVAIFAGCFVILNTTLYAAEENGWTALLGGETLDAWRGDTGTWYAAGDAALAPDNPERLVGADGDGVAINGEDGRTKHLVSVMEHGDVEAHVEFLVAKNSNSGVYFMGRYEVQVLDSWGEENPEYSDCGGLYQRYNPDEVPEGERNFEGKPPSVNASKKPGEWQTFDVIFKAPRFDADGAKIADAEFIEVKHNGIVVHENVKVAGPTRAAMFKDEEATGPLMLQGDHGPVAYRNIRIRRVNLE